MSTLKYTFFNIKLVVISYLYYFLFSKVVVPFLLFIFSTEDRTGSKMDLELAKTPVKLTKDGPSLLSPVLTSPRIPASNEYNTAVKSAIKMPNVHFESSELKKMGAEIIYFLLKQESTKELSLETNKGGYLILLFPS